MFRVSCTQTLGLLALSLTPICWSFTNPVTFLAEPLRLQNPAVSQNSALLQQYQNTKLYSSSEYLVKELEVTTSSSEWERELSDVGLVRIESAMQKEQADACGYHFDDQKIMAWFAGTAEGEEDQKIFASRSFYGTKKSENFYELQLSLMRAGYAADFGKNVSDTERHVLADVLFDVIGPDGTLTPLLENLVTSEGELYELAAIISSPGHEVEEGQIESILKDDIRLADVPPLFTVFLATHDVDINMGPTTYFTNTHDEHVDEESLNGNAPPRRSLMNKGDAVVIDSRILCTYYSNDAQLGNPFTLLKLSFRNPEYTGDLGYAGSLRPGYREKKITLGQLKETLLAYKNGDGDSFKKFGDGIEKADSDES